MEKRVQYYFSPSSPWTYLGHGRLMTLAARHGARIDVRPVDLGGTIFPATGGLPVDKRPKARQAYRLVELERWSAHLGMRLNLQPRHFPVSASLAARLIIAADIIHGADAALELAGRIMSGVWAEEKNIADAGTLAAMATDTGLDATALAARAASAEIDRRYRQYTDEAVARGVFGAPFYTYRDEPFWGQDRLEFLERALAR